MIEVKENKVLADGEYARVIVKDGGDDNNVYDAAILRQDEKLFLLSDNIRRNGYPCDMRARELIGFRFSWVLNGDAKVKTFVDACTDIELKVLSIGDKKFKKAKFIPDMYARRYSTDVQYSGFHGYHSHRGQKNNELLKANPKYKFGIELEVEFPSYSSREDFVRKVSNWFYCERDGSLNDGGCEVITIPLHPNDAKSGEFWEGLTSNLVRASVSNRTGLHVHVSKTVLGDGDAYEENLGKLLFAYHHYWNESPYNVKIFGRERGYHASEGKTNHGKAVELLGPEVLKESEIKSKVTKAMIRHSEHDRYFDINITNDHTIEFRKGLATLDPNRIAMLVEYVELLCKYAIKTSWHKISTDSIKDFLQKNAKNNILKTILSE